MTSALSVDVENEFRDVLNEASLLADALERATAAKNEADDVDRWVRVGGLAAGCEKIYSGCERIMSLLAQRLDGDAVEKTESWHSVLLNRMANPYPGTREEIISSECREALDRLRAFRHRVRSNYGMRLDRDIVLARAAEVRPALEMFHRDVAAFLKARETEEQP